MKSSTGVHFMSERMDWKTPKAVYQTLHAEFGFNHDPCPAKWDGLIDGLQSSWGGGVNYVNPPYGRELPLWIAKAYEQWQLGKTVVLLIPSRTDTRWWHDFCMQASEIRFIKGRLRFDDQPNPAPFPSCLVIFRA